MSLLYYVLIEIVHTAQPKASVLKPVLEQTAAGPNQLSGVSGFPRWG